MYLLLRVARISSQALGSPLGNLGRYRPLKSFLCCHSSVVLCQTNECLRFGYRLVTKIVDVDPIVQSRRTDRLFQFVITVFASVTVDETEASNGAKGIIPNVTNHCFPFALRPPSG